MDLNLLTIARRATLSSSLNAAFTNALAKVAQIETLTKKVELSEEFTAEEKEHNRSFSIIGLTSIAEHLLNDVLYRILTAYPKKLSGKQFTIDELLEEGSVLELFYKKANSKVLELAYGKFEKFVRHFADTLELTSSLSHELVSTINEVKCTRDCIIHSDGKANDLYFAKAGQKARVFRNEDKLNNSPAYFIASIAAVTQFITDIKAGLPAQYTDSSKSYIFKQMWESTCLRQRFKFNQIWEIIDGSMVRPIDIDNDYGFSSSELVVHNLFRHMYQLREYTVDFPLLFSKWKPQSNEHQVALSWLDNQFYF